MYKREKYFVSLQINIKLMKINKHLLTLLFSLLLLSDFSQNISFSKIYAPYINNINSSFSGHAIVSNGNNYVLCAVGHDSVYTLNNNQGLYFYNIDSINYFKQIIQAF